MRLLLVRKNPIGISTPCHAQAAKTYLERKFEEFPSCDVDALLQHGLKVKTLSIFSVMSRLLPCHLLLLLFKPASCLFKFSMCCWVAHCTCGPCLTCLQTVRAEVTNHVSLTFRNCLQALSASVTEDELNAENTAVAIVGKGTPFTILEGKDLEPYLANLKAEEDTAPGAEIVTCFICIPCQML